MQSCLQASTSPKASYSSVVKGTADIEPTIRIPSVIKKSTLLSTTDAPICVTQQGSATHKAPFRLVPVMPPKKDDMTKKTLSVVD